MPRKTLVDAFNVIHAVPWLERRLAAGGPGGANGALLGLCRRWARTRDRRDALVVVFDGIRPRGTPLGAASGVEVRYVDDADADLLRLLERRGIERLVTADAELVAAARRLAVEVVAPASFVGDLLAEVDAAGQVAERHRIPSDDEVAYWLGEFGLPPEVVPAADPEVAASEDPEALSPDEVQGWLDYFGEA